MELSKIHRGTLLKEMVEYRMHQSETRGGKQWRNEIEWEERDREKEKERWGE